MPLKLGCEWFFSFCISFLFSSLDLQSCMHLIKQCCVLQARVSMRDVNCAPTMVVARFRSF